MEASGEVEQVASTLDEGLNSQDPTGQLYPEALGSMLPVGRKLKMEIPVYTDLLEGKESLVWIDEDL